MSDGEGCCFDDWARHDARRARRRDGPDRVTGALVDALAEVGLRDRSLLEVGCGVGELTLACLDRGADRATGTDLSREAVDQARRLAEERGRAGRARFVVADGSVAPLEQHDVVVLNRVICCFPDAAALVDHTAAAARTTYGVVLPRSEGLAGLVARVAIGTGNLVFRLRRRRFGDYRAFVHDVAALERRLAAVGLRRVRHRRVRLVWHLAVYERDG
ncbi:class I SAM-dependent methyltransferase [Nocardioides coralli]|uniref:class I SAM-dependent methyltransferase n=1 Tax=Nocardioides coralli TaxID=2872154 RepID=UPI001CA42A41|nr:class I SAM-dependent methyltransferase [Nocardioides coralli]QZY30407.1 class I SAM-dependent methyltransferase [Nocardioides coralli]